MYLSSCYMTSCDWRAAKPAALLPLAVGERPGIQTEAFSWLWSPPLKSALACGV